MKGSYEICKGDKVKGIVKMSCAAGHEVLFEIHGEYFDKFYLNSLCEAICAGHDNIGGCQFKTEDGGLCAEEIEAEYEEPEDQEEVFGAPA